MGSKKDESAERGSMYDWLGDRNRTFGVTDTKTIFIRDRIVTVDEILHKLNVVFENYKK